jgi:hypothetical protein
LRGWDADERGKLRLQDPTINFRVYPRRSIREIRSVFVVFLSGALLSIVNDCRENDHREYDSSDRPRSGFCKVQRERNACPFRDKQARIFRIVVEDERLPMIGIYVPVHGLILATIKLNSVMS